MDKKFILIIAVISVLAAISSVFIYNYYQNPYRKCMREISSDLKINKSQYLKGDVIVNFKDTASKEEQARIIQSYNYQIVYRYSKNSALVKVPSGQEMDSICRLRGSPQISSASLNVIFNLKF